MRGILLGFCMVLAWGSQAQAETQPRLDPAMAKDYDCDAYFRRTQARYCVELVTMGQGKWLFTYFGHNAIRVVDRLRRGRTRDVIFNFGTFAGNKPLTLVWNYLQFKLRYSLSIASYRWSLKAYIYMDRSYRVRRLLLSKAETRKLVRHLWEHYRPENRIYPYHHYTNNCSTKLRDALHKVIGPSFRKHARVKRGATYRSFVMKQMRPNPLVQVLMDFGMGPPADRPLDWWAEMFLPDHLEEYGRLPIWRQLRGAPLLGPERLLYKRKAKPAFPWNPKVIIWCLALLWLIFGFVLHLYGRLRGYVRLTLFLFALIGSALLFMLVGTRFPEPPGNLNILWFHPLHGVVWWWLGKKRWQSASMQRKHVVRWYFSIHLLLAVLYLLLKLLSVVPVQTNAHYVFFALFVFGLASFRLWLFGDDWQGKIV